MILFFVIDRQISYGLNELLTKKGQTVEVFEPKIEDFHGTMKQIGIIYKRILVICVTQLAGGALLKKDKII